MVHGAADGVAVISNKNTTTTMTTTLKARRRWPLAAAAALAAATGLALAPGGCGDKSSLGSGSGGLVCAGVATTCAELSGAACTAAQGCIGGACSGTAQSCTIYTDASTCAIQVGCTWDTAASICNGTVHACGVFQSPSTCNGQVGCSWTPGCFGRPADCASLAPSACGAQPGCHLEQSDGGAVPAQNSDCSTDSHTPSVCDGAFVPNPADLIDDMEDGDAAIVPGPANRNGSWFVYDDGTATGTITPGPNDTITMEPIVGGRCGSTKAMRVSGSGFDGYGAGFGLAFSYDANGEVEFDYSAYTGLVFWARIGDGTTDRVRLNVPDKATEPAGGICDVNSTEVGKQCYDHFGTMLTGLSTTWKQYKIPFSSLTQRMFGVAEPMIDTTALFGVEFAIDPSTVFDVWIDDLSLYK
jgi:hypothetical protein